MENDIQEIPHGPTSDTIDLIHEMINRVFDTVAHNNTRAARYKWTIRLKNYDYTPREKEGCQRNCVIF